MVGIVLGIRIETLPDDLREVDEGSVVEIN